MTGINFERFEREVMRARNPELTPRDKLLAAALGCAGEGGEVADLVKKHIEQGHPINYAKLREELGDVLHYVVAMAQTLGYSLESIALGHVEKLRGRYPEGFSVERSINRGETK